MNSSYYGSVNGPACHYARLVRYNKCSLAEVAATPQPTTTDYNFYEKGLGSSASASAREAEERMRRGFTGTAGPVSSTTQNIGIPVESVGPSSTGFRGVEGFTGPESEYVPSYKVPNYPPINIDALTHGQAGKNCGGYFNILSAYSGMGQDGSSCTTNFINN